MTFSKYYFAMFLIFTTTAKAADTLNSLAEPIHQFCIRTNEGEKCETEQLEAAKRQKLAFEKAFNSRTSEGLTMIAHIARCTKKYTTPAGIDHIKAEKCNQSIK